MLKKSKMIAGGSPESPLEGPWRVPGGSLEGPWDAPGASEHRSRPPLEKWQKSFEKLNGLEAQKSRFWDRDPKIHKKTILGPKSAARNQFFIEFSRTHRFSNFQAQFLVNC